MTMNENFGDIVLEKKKSRQPNRTLRNKDFKVVTAAGIEPATN